MKKLILSGAILLSGLLATGQVIKVNQIGFYPASKKVAVVPETTTGQFEIISEDGTKVEYSGTMGAAATWAYSGESVRLADFSAFTKPGKYKVRVAGTGTSHTFEISQNANEELVKGTIKAYYYNRSSTQLTQACAGKFARSAGHPDTRVYVHSSAATTTRPAGTIISSPRGWYDAGDYNKYIVNSGISTYTLLALYEHYPVFSGQIQLNIPESSNDIPDLLDESLWNIEWMLSMQDEDGGVYHKLTTKAFCGSVMPDKDIADRYVVMKTTAATLDFAAVMAMSARIFKEFESAKPGFAAKCEQAAKKAWTWAKANPAVYYTQPADISTGTYGDRTVTDEFDWAGAELFILTGDESYLTYSSVLSSPMSVPSWGNVAGLTWISLAHHRNKLSAANKTTVENKILTQANTLYNAYTTSAYNVAMGTAAGDFTWGSNGVAGNQGFVLMQAYAISGDKKYLHAAASNLDYLLGRNPTGYSFVTAYGDKTPQDIHHRQSESDGIAEPVPGWLAGGPHTGKQDKCAYPANCLAATCYVDVMCSYATNEVTINWNAPLVYLAAAIHSVQAENVISGSITPLSATTEVSVYPNPSVDNFWIDLNGLPSGSSTVSILDTKGEVLYQTTMQNGTTGKIHFNALPGMYLVKVMTENGMKVINVVKM
jgi:endoglucanase